MAFREVQNVQLDQQPESAPRFREVSDVQLDAEPKKNNQNQPSVLDSIKRQAGLTARAGIEGLAALPAIPANALAYVSNKALEKTGSDFRFPEQSQALSGVLTSAGLPEPQTKTEQVVQDVSQAVTGAGALAKGAQMAGGMASKALGSRPALEATAAAGSAGASSVVGEAGGNAGAQAIAGLAGGLTPVAVSGFIKKNPSQVSKLFEDISENGIDNVGAFRALKRELGEEAAEIQAKMNGVVVGGKVVKEGLFSRAKRLGKEAYVPEQKAEILLQDLRQQAADAIGVNEKQVLSNAADNLENLLAAGNVQVNALETIRRAGSKASAAGGDTASAGKYVIRSIDDLLGTSPIIGNSKSVKIWKEAIKTRRDFGTKFEKPNAIAKAIDDGKTTESIEQIFLGKGPIGRKGDVGEVYMQTVKALPEEKKEIGKFLMKQSVINQMVKRSIRTTDSGDAISASSLADDIRGIRKDNQTLWKMYSPDERRVLNELESSLRKEIKGGPLNKVAAGLVKLLRFGTRSNIELPRTVKPKTVMDVDELLNLTKLKPYKGSNGKYGVLIGVNETIEEEQ